jgi:hypothetical protein
MLNAQVGRAKEGQELLRQQLSDVQIELDTIYEVGNGCPLSRITWLSGTLTTAPGVQRRARWHVQRCESTTH